jgi:ATP-dependent DNA ligase
VFFLFDLLYIDGEDLSLRTLIERKDRLAVLLANVSAPLHYFDHQIGHGRVFFEKACAMSLEGIVSKRTDAAYPALVGNISFGIRRLRSAESGEKRGGKLANGA